MKNLRDISEIEFDALKEIGNVGIGNAATAISKLMNKKVEIDLPKTGIIHYSRLADELGGPERIVNAVYIQIKEDMDGEAVFVFPESGALELVDLLDGKPVGTTKSMSEFNESAFKEMANIFIGSYLKALSKMLDMTIMQTVPHIACDMAQSLLDMMLIRFSIDADEVLMLRTKIEIEGHNLDGTFMLILDPASFQKMLKQIKKKYEI